MSVRELSPSVANAMVWAAAASELRSGSPQGTTEIDTPDLAVGLLLAHEDGDHLKTLLDHYAITLNELLGDWYDEPFTPGVLAERVAARQSSTSEPTTTAEVDMVLDEASKLASDRTDQTEVFLKAAVIGLVTTNNPVSARFDKLLADRLGNSSLLRSRLPDAVREQGGLGDFLVKELPWSAPPRIIPTYQSDQPIARRISSADPETDYLGTERVARAFAYLLSSVKLNPPLAVGVFGHWGTGKSYFLRSLQREIDRLTQDPKLRDRAQDELPVFKNVIQIEFNAWQYVDGELWPSLVEHIFSNLCLRPDVDVSELEARQDRLLEQIVGARQAQVAARSETERLQNDLNERRTAVKTTRIEVTRAHEELEERRKEDPLGRPARDEVMREVEAAVPDFESLGASIRELRGALQQAHGVYERSRGVNAFLETRSPKWRFALVGLVAIAPVTSMLMSILEAPAVTNALTSATVLLGAIATAIRNGTRAVDAQLLEVERVQSLLDEEIDRAKREAQDQLAAAESNVDAAELALDTAQMAERQADSALMKLNDDLKHLTSTRILNDFLTERIGSDDYRSRLGIAAMIRRDFEALSSLIEAQNSELLVGARNVDETGVNRIILYIDDLDRCDNDVVLAVLQAVHLLLAFPLFVVVVAVDPRWLADALTEKYTALTRAQSDGRASASDYIEKIFQIPLYLRSLSPESRQSLLDGLLAPTVGPAAGSAAAEVDDGDQQPVEISDERARLVESLFDKRDNRVDQLIDALRLNAKELEYLESLAPLLGDTARAVKRFTNTYQLARVLAKDGADPGTGDSPAELERLGFLLAISNGRPAFAESLVGRIYAANGSSTTIKDDIEALRKDHPDEAATLIAWLSSRNEASFLSADLAQAAETVSRFAFRLPA